MNVKFLIEAIFCHSTNVWIIAEPWKVLIWPKYLLIWYPDLNAISQTRYILQAHWKIWGLLGFLPTIFCKIGVFHNSIVILGKNVLFCPFFSWQWCLLNYCSQPVFRPFHQAWVTKQTKFTRAGIFAHLSHVLSHIHYPMRLLRPLTWRVASVL